MSTTQSGGTDWRCVYVPVDKGGAIGLDKLIEATTLYKVFRHTNADTGVVCSLHDPRRTLATTL